MNIMRSSDCGWADRRGGGYPIICSKLGTIAIDWKVNSRSESAPAKALVRLLEVVVQEFVWDAPYIGVSLEVLTV